MESHPQLLPLRDHQGRGGYPFLLRIQYLSCHLSSCIDGYLKENKFRLRSEVGVISDFYKSTNQDYIVHCEVREGKAALISLDVSVPDKDQAEIMCGHWKERSQEIYSFVMRSLMRSE